MGRSFSVYLFCLAMDPLFTYLNRIPGVLSVQGYIDDTTIAGDVQCLDWLTEVSECHSSLKTAGFVVDPHSGFGALLLSIIACDHVAASVMMWMIGGQVSSLQRDISRR